MIDWDITVTDTHLLKINLSVNKHRWLLSGPVSSWAPGALRQQQIMKWGETDKLETRGHFCCGGW